MKKMLCLLCVCLLCVSVFSACGEKKDVSETPEIVNNSETETNKEPEKEVPLDTPLAPSENKEVVTADEAPEIHIINNGGTNNAHICYHLKDCKLLKGTEHQEVTWEMVEMIQFRQCPECNPPRYKNYIE